MPLKSLGTQIGRRLRYAKDRPLLYTLLVIHSFFLVTALAWFCGLFEPVELAVYDTLLSLHARGYGPSGAVVIVGASENDLNRFDWPLNDGRLADLIEQLESGHPAAIAIDLYRDRPRGEGYERLKSVFTHCTNVVAAFELKSSALPDGIPPPTALKDTDRIAFSDTVPDSGGVLRRLLLLAGQDGVEYESLGFRLARMYLAAHGIEPSLDPNNSRAIVLGKSKLLPLSTYEGGYVDADNGGFQILGGFAGGPHPFPLLSFSQVLDGNFDPKVLSDKMVIVGVAADSVKDFFFTPFSAENGKIYGSEAHGHVAAQVTRSALGEPAPVRGTSLPVTVLIVWAGCMVGGLSAGLLRSTRAVAAACAGHAGAMLATSYIALNLGLWIPLVGPTVAIVGSTLIQTAMLRDRERAERSLLMNIFGQLVSKNIAEDLWNKRSQFTAGGRPSPQVLAATVLFTDIKDFTKTAEELDASDVLAWLNAYMEVMERVIDQFGGVINKFIGDSIMVLFGVPIPRTREDQIRSDAKNAVACALELSRALKHLNQSFAAAGRPTIAMRIGINSGPLVAGTLGSTRRLEYTVIGDTVNVASRLESYDKSLAADTDCRIIVSGSTMECLKEMNVRSILIGNVGLKGKDACVPAYLIQVGQGYQIEGYDIPHVSE